MPKTSSDYLRSPRRPNFYAMIVNAISEQILSMHISDLMFISQNRLLRL
jgi:hypothetical protein